MKNKCLADVLKHPFMTGHLSQQPNETGMSTSGPNRELDPKRQRESSPLSQESKKFRGSA